jgi:hypothetical protein
MVSVDNNQRAESDVSVAPDAMQKAIASETESFPVPQIDAARLIAVIRRTYWNSHELIPRNRRMST